MERNQFCKVPVMELGNLINTYEALVSWIHEKNFAQVEETLFELHLNYNNTNPYALRVLVGELTIKMPTDTLSYFADFFITKLHISTKEVEYYVENRIHLILEQNEDAWHKGIEQMLTDQAYFIIQNSLKLDEQHRIEKLETAVNSWADQVMVA